VFWLANLTGQPSVVIPTASSSPPLAVQLVGRPFRDDALLDVAEAVEEVLPV
jgi:Asp-tRNA(Asn)/Glu-tRNA(Gln) amidotransferase A subunit family amidase